jgi:hypothetical protein
MMKSRLRSNSNCNCRLYSSMSAWSNEASGKKLTSRATADWMKWMLVDSSGSMKPLARPIATQFRFQNFLRMPVTKRSGRGSASASPSRFASSVAAASSSLM